MKLTKNLLLLALILFSGNLFAQENEELLINIYNRESTSLNGTWNYIVDPYENGFYDYRYRPFENNPDPWKSAFFLNSHVDNKSELLEYNFDTSPTMELPTDWNTAKENLFFYEGTVWFKKSFDYNKLEEGKRAFVYFEASNYETHVYFNGKKLGKHLGGFTPFNYEVTDLLKEKDNFLVVKVDNKRKKEAVPTLNTDWWNYGGITRDIRILETPANFVQDYFIQLDPEDPRFVKGFVQLDGENIANKKITISIPEIKINKEIITDENGYATVEFKSRKIKKWAPGNPRLYRVMVQTDTDKLEDQIGFRTIDTEGTDILLNGKSIFLRGICLHEESPLTGGRGYSMDDAKLLLGWAKELGCNYVRLAHYPHNEHMVRLADRMGILVWEENPVYWTIDWENEATFQNAKNQLTEVINRDKNRASVIIWSMANETPTSDARNKFLTKLADHTREMDPTRLISAALEQKDYNGDKNVRTIDDPFADVVDILNFNQYIGWYDGLPDKCNQISWHITQNKPVMISEFGAGAKFGNHADKDTRWSEEFQEDLYVQTLKMLDRVDQLRGFSPWILVDFRSPRRMLPEIQDGWNRKGLLSEVGEKKKAFFILQEYYKNKAKE